MSLRLTTGHGNIIPAEAGIQNAGRGLDSHFRGNDGYRRGIFGYQGGWVDHAMMRIVDVLFAIPDLLLIILITVVIGRGFWGIFLALSLISWVGVARLFRGGGLGLKGMPYIQGARGGG